MKMRTDYEQIGIKYYCLYCGKEITPEEHYCEGAENSQKIELLQNRQKELKKSADLILNPLRRDQKIKERRSRYDHPW